LENAVDANLTITNDIGDIVFTSLNSTGLFTEIEYANRTVIIDSNGTADVISESGPFTLIAEKNRLPNFRDTQHYRNTRRTYHNSWGYGKERAISRRFIFVYRCRA
jgi:hypothetical protein